MKTLAERILERRAVSESEQSSADRQLREKAKTAPAGDEIIAVCQALADMLIDKNIAYGNSALEPVRIFSKATPEEQILVRLDDKLSRLQSGQAAGEDVTGDLLGYLILLTTLRARPGVAGGTVSIQGGDPRAAEFIRLPTGPGGVALLEYRNSGTPGIDWTQATQPSESAPIVVREPPAFLRERPASDFIPTIGRCQECNVEIPFAEERVICEECSRRKGFGRAPSKPNEGTSEGALR